MSGITIEKIDDKCTRFTFTNGSLVVLIRNGDLSQEQCDAIVNSTNSHMLPSGGVDRLIHQKLGQFFTDQVIAIYKAMGAESCPIGQSRIFVGRFEKNDNDVSYVINTVGPAYNEAEKERAAFLLKSCYHTSFTLANLYGLSSIAYPAISCGAHFYPAHEAACVAIESAREFACNVKDVRFVLFDRPIYEVFVRAWTDYAQQVNSAANDSNPVIASTGTSTATGSGRYCVLCKDAELPSDRQLLCLTCSELARPELFIIFLARLRAAAEVSFEELACQCEILKPILKSYTLVYNPVQTFDVTIHRRDNVAEEYLEHYCTPEFHSSKPVAVAGDGNCFYNSFVRLVEAGSATSTPSLTATELRVRNIVELALNVNQYRAQYGHLSSLLHNFKKYATKDMVRDSTTISVWDLLSIPTVLNINLVSVYPRVNSDGDTHFQHLNMALFIPLVDDNDEEKTELSADIHDVKLLFSCSDRPKTDATQPQSEWSPNHFVPLLDLKKS